MTNELVHFGVKGMKWGVRRNRSSPTTQGLKARRAAKKQELLDNMHDDYKKAHENKSISSMSDAELRARINRIQMERQYSQLNPSAISKGKECASKSLKTMTMVATTTGTILTIYNNVDKIKKLLGE